jgi:hypothetical protein
MGEAPIDGVVLHLRRVNSLNGPERHSLCIYAVPYPLDPNANRHEHARQGNSCYGRDMPSANQPDSATNKKCHYRQRGKRVPITSHRVFMKELLFAEEL